MEKEINTEKRNLIRIHKVVEAELLIEQKEYNKNSKWWNFKKFDYAVFSLGFTAGMEYYKRIQEGHNLETEEKQGSKNNGNKH